MQRYRGFSEDFESECAWVAYAQDVAPEADTVAPAAEALTELDVEEDAKDSQKDVACSDTQHAGLDLPYAFGMDSQTNVNSKDQDGNQLQPPTKKIKLGDLVPRMQRRNREHQDDITALTTELTTLRRKLRSTETLQNTITDQAYEIGTLQEQVHTMTVKNESSKAFQREVKKIVIAKDKAISDLKDKVLIMQQAMEVERKKTKDAEGKLKNYLKAQKKMAAEFSELGE